MSQAKSKTIASTLLSSFGTFLLVMAAYSLYLGFLSPMNRGRGLEGGAAFLCLVLGSLGAYLLRKAGKMNKGKSQSSLQESAGQK